MVIAKRRRKKKNQLTPTKALSKPTDFGKVKVLTSNVIENISKRAVVQHYREKHPEYSKATVISKTGYSKPFVYKHWENPSLEDKPRSGRPRSARTPAVMLALKNSRGKLKNNSTRKVAKKLSKKHNHPVSHMSISRGFNDLGLPYLKRGTVSKLTDIHVNDRYEWSKEYKDEPVDFWEEMLITDEKVWEVDGYSNPQNEGVRETSAKNVPPKKKSKFPGKRMTWMGVSPRGTTKFLVFPAGTSVNGDFYQKNVLTPVLKDVKSRTGGPRIDQKKLFDDPENFIFEHDWAKAHATWSNERFLEKNAPYHTPVLRSLKGKAFWMPPVLDDFWYVERCWAEMATSVYEHPPPQNIKQLLYRVRRAHKKLTVEFLTKRCHELPARINEIYRLKGEKIHPSWKVTKDNPHACHCHICDP